MNTENQSVEISFAEISSDELIDYISFQNEFPVEAQKAFTEFCFRFEKEALKKAEIYCGKFGMNEVQAELVANCAFARVWKYHSFDKNKARSKNIDTAIRIWLLAIVYNEVIKFSRQNSCSEQEEEDLFLIETVDSLINATHLDDEIKKSDLKMKLEVIDRAMQGLSQKHITVYLTYLAYEKKGKNIPRNVAKLLRERLGLAQNSIQVYKKTAIDHIKNYLLYINGNTK
jgi:hypothetical protein